MTNEEQYIQYIHECLRRLQEQYYKDAEPFMKRLAQLKSLETQTLLIDVNTWSLPSSEITGENKRCTLCNYQHGHQIGCENNPVDIALQHGITAMKDSTSKP